VGYATRCLGGDISLIGPWRVPCRYTFRGMKVYEYTAVVEFDDEAKAYVAHVPGLTGAHTYADNLTELQQRLQEVVALVLEGLEERGDPIEPDSFIGIQKVTVQR
jgi:predicted RNase H-like HicB family nuclease